MCALIRKVMCTISDCILPYNSETVGRAGMLKGVSLPSTFNFVIKMLYSTLFCSTFQFSGM